MTDFPVQRMILVRHARPEINPDMPSADWPLAKSSRRQCHMLADLLRLLSPTSITSSQEQKAVSTGELLAEALALPVSTAPGLHEHARGSVGFLNPNEFHDSIRALFARPNDRIFGSESACEATSRFADAISAVLEQETGECPVIVCHGTVMSLYVAAHNDVEPYELWRQLGLPAFVVLSMPDRTVERIVGTIT
jgi:broad specificity phosphatase PhoE